MKLNNFEIFEYFVFCRQLTPARVVSNNNVHFPTPGCPTKTVTVSLNVTNNPSRCRQLHVSLFRVHPFDVNSVQALSNTNVKLLELA